MGNPGHSGSYPKALRENRGCCPISPTTGRGFLGENLHWLGLAADEVCPLCDHARMDGNHLLQSTGFDEFLRRQSVKRESASKGLEVNTGVGYRN
ncbi:hypothetical protein TNCV_3037301 [Trichonephila clavipes]|nr:hypothetical protein TNCV_3037301 [Trichonephila clavipes]